MGYCDGLRTAETWAWLMLHASSKGWGNNAGKPGAVLHHALLMFLGCK